MKTYNMDAQVCCSAASFPSEASKPAQWQLPAAPAAGIGGALLYDRPLYMLLLLQPSAETAPGHAAAAAAERALTLGTAAPHQSGYLVSLTRTQTQPTLLLLLQTHSGNSSPASMRMYLSLTPTSMQFMPISPSPPIGSTRSGGPLEGGGPGRACRTQVLKMLCEEHILLVLLVANRQHTQRRAA